MILKRFFMHLLKYGYPFAFLILSACGGGGGGDNNAGTPTPTPTPTFSAEATLVKGLVNGASCELFQVTALGVMGDSLANGTTLNGQVDFGNSIEYQGTALIECSPGGTYTDEATGNPMVAPMLRAIVDLNGNISSVVSPLTEIATQLAEADGNLNLALSTYNDSVADAFGFDADITNVVPTDLNTTVATDNESGEHGTLLALFSQLNANDPDSLEQVIDLSLIHI